MRLRAEIKAQAKAAFQANYGVSLAVIVVFMAIGAMTAYIGPLSFLVLIPLELGVICHFTSVFYGGRPEFATMFQQGFGFNYGRKLGGILWMGLWVFLWSLLFVIPGIIKAYEYALTPYILANYPDVEAMEALNLSKRMTKGHKADLFVFDLSFIGWHLLSALTFGLLEIFYVAPYQSTATCGYLGELIETSVRNGVVAPHELNKSL
ncbi:MAG: DUF975 family protein [Oscillospiraceae bacterium]|nr:DUF975 family protein [Oscillospiraceae bacterium]